MGGWDPGEGGTGFQAGKGSQGGGTGPPALGSPGGAPHHPKGLRLWGPPSARGAGTLALGEGALLTEVVLILRVCGPGAHVLEGSDKGGQRAHFVWKEKKDRKCTFDIEFQKN